MSQAIRITILVENQTFSPERFEEATRKAREEAERVLRAYGIKTVGSVINYGPPTKDENILLAPRKIHFGFDGFPQCRVKGLGQVAKKRTVEDWGKVTCTHCLKKLPALQAIQGKLL